MQPTLFNTARLMYRAHAGQVDKSGMPYWRHPYRVMLRLRHLGQDYCRAALLHDVIEDTDLTADDLRECDFSEAVVQSVERVTRLPQDGLTYMQWIRGISDSDNPIALFVKYADITDNSDPTRATTPQLQAMVSSRYGKAMPIIESALRRVVGGIALAGVENWTPCVLVCQQHDSGHCIACGRRPEHLRSWGRMTDEQRWDAIEEVLRDE